MASFVIIRHDDYHGDVILFSIMDEDGHECDRVVSEAEALWVVAYFEALAEAEARAPAFSDQTSTPAPTSAPCSSYASAAE